MQDQNREEILKESLLPVASTQKKPTSRFLGLLLGVLAYVFLHIQKLFSKLAMENSTLTPYDVTYFRSLALFFIFIGVPLCRKTVSYIRQPPEVLITLILRGFINVWSGLSLYLALQLIPYSEAVLLSELRPVFGSLLAFIMLGERILPVEVAALLISLLAVYVYADPGGYLNGGAPRAQDFKDGVTPGNLLGIFFGIMKGFTGGLGSVLLRKVGKAKTSFQLPVFYMGLLGVIFMPMVIVPHEIVTSTEHSVSPLAIFYLLMVGVCLALGQSILYLAYRRQKATTVLLTGYTEIILAIFLDLNIFDSTLRWTDYLASALIFAGTFIIFLHKCKKG